jgi:hypothetical protein
MLRLKCAHRAEAAMCLEPETDRAFSIIVARLSDLHDGDPFVTFSALWNRAVQQLRQPDQRARIASVVEGICRRRELQGQEILAILRS